MPQITKCCTKCNQVKLLDQFYRHPDCRHGREPQCKVCRNEQDRAWWVSHPERVAEIQRRSASHRKRHPKRMKARLKTAYAVRTGKIPRATHCEACGQQGKLETHHPDYEQWGNIVWLCRPCHLKVHK